MKYLLLLLIVGCAAKTQDNWSSLDCGGDPLVGSWLQVNDDELSFVVAESCAITIESCNATGLITQRIDETGTEPAYAITTFETSDATPGCPALGEVKCRYVFEPRGWLNFNCDQGPPYHTYERAP